MGVVWVTFGEFGGCFVAGLVEKKWWFNGRVLGLCGGVLVDVISVDGEDGCSPRVS